MAFLDGTDDYLPWANAPFPALVTARKTFPGVVIPTSPAGSRGAGLPVWAHEWKEQIVRPDTAAYEDVDGGRVGTVAPLLDCPAVELNNRPTPAGTLVWMRLRGVQLGTQIFEFSVCPFGTWARLTATGGGLYSWQEVYRDSATTWANLPNGLAGTLNAGEANNRTGAAVGAADGDVVSLRLAYGDDDTPRWVFDCTTCGTTTLEPCQGCGCWIGVQTDSCLRVDLVSVGGGACACLPQPQGPFYLRNDGTGLCWTQATDTTSPTPFQTCCLNIVDDYGGYMAAGPLVFCLDADWRPYMYVQGTFPSCSTDPATDYLGGDVTDPRFSLDCCTSEGGFAVAYFRGGGSAFCNGTPTEPECDNTFLLRVQRTGFASCEPPVTGCCPGPLPGVLYLHIDVLPGAPAGASRFAGDWTLISDGFQWSASKDDPNPDDTPNADVVTVFCDGGLEYPPDSGSFIWFPCVELRRAPWFGVGGPDPGVSVDVGPCGDGSSTATCDSPVTGSAHTADGTIFVSITE